MWIVVMMVLIWGWYSPGGLCVLVIMGFLLLSTASVMLTLLFSQKYCIFFRFVGHTFLRLLIWWKVFLLQPVDSSSGWVY